MGEDIFTEPELDPNTLANLGPLTGMAGIWEGTAGTDVHPVAPDEGGTETDTYVERYELQPIDPQTNGPQYFYGLRYHVHKPGEVETYVRSEVAATAVPRQRRSPGVAVHSGHACRRSGIRRRCSGVHCRGCCRHEAAQ
jgi:hypothetical protein